MVKESNIGSDELDRAKEIYKRVVDEIKKVIVDMDDVIEMLFIGLITRSHILLEGVPGIAKTTLAKTMAKTLNLDFVRIQFTPDLLPADIIGSYVYSQEKDEFYLRKGPIFANLILADEINRGNPKTQSALLEAMQERQVTIEGNTLSLPDPFMVIATQNPIEMEGTYPLPAAQIDRFMAKVIVEYPDKESTIEILERYTTGYIGEVEVALSYNDIIELQNLVLKIHASQDMIDYVSNIIEVSRRLPQIKLGVSPRGGIALLLASKAKALIEGRDYVIPDDIKKTALHVLNHRIYLTPDAVFEGITPLDMVKKILDSVEVPT